jgi:hypothetical protein
MDPQSLNARAAPPFGDSLDLEMADNLQYLPWTWTVKPSDPNTHCPPASSILGTFAVVNVLVSIIGLIFGNRLVANFVSCGVFGRPGSTGWAYLWIITLALQFGSNAVAAAIIKHTSGYGSGFAIIELMLFYITRPRLSWIFLAAFGGVKRQKKENTPSANQYDIPITDREAAVAPMREYNSPHRRSASRNEESQTEYPWATSFISQFIAELVLQVINLAIIGSVVHFAATRGYYHIDHQYSVPHAAHLMYAGALLYVVLLPVFLYTFFAMYISRREGRFTMSKIGKVEIGLVQYFVGCLAVSSWLASWLFWSGYVLLAGNL